MDTANLTLPETITALEHRLQGALLPGAARVYRSALDYLRELDTLQARLRGPTREMVERMRGCSDCQRKTCVSCRRFGRVPQRCIYCNNQDKWRPWNFCPVCGKPLTAEAVDMMVSALEGGA